MAALLSAVLLAACGGTDSPSPVGPGQVGPRQGFAEVAAALSAMIEREREDKDLAAVSIALVDGDGVVWAAGFGEQAPGVPATPETVYRVGSVSKLFTDIAIMQLAEAGEADIDAPVRDYLPGFAPGGSAESAITLRQLMSHRSGLVREPPAGNYFDDTGTTLAATVASLSGPPLVYEPGSRAKYSNAGVAVAGYVLEATQGEPFADYVARAVLEPLAMNSSAFSPEPDIVDDLAKAYMWGFDRGLFEAPRFELGMAPAGSMYSTALDLARFMGAMFRRGEGENGRVLQPETLESMWEPQYAEPGAVAGSGLGFQVAELFGGHRWLGHGGAIYGFSTQLAFLPDAELGVVAVSAVDGTNSVVGRVADAALELMLAAESDEAMPQDPLRGTDPVDPSLALEVEGVYGTGYVSVEFDERNGRLFATPGRGGSTVEIRAVGDTLVVDDRLAFGDRFLPTGEGLLAFDDGLVPLSAAVAEDGPNATQAEDGGRDSQLLPRQVPSGLPPALPARWTGLIGEYGWDHNVLYILERNERLHALIEWFFLYPLEEVSADIYAFPEGGGLYHGERLIFSRDASGRAVEVEAASVVFPRREVGAEGEAGIESEAGAEGELTLEREAGAETRPTFRIVPVRPVEALRDEALAASPPEEEGAFRDPDLVEVAGLEPEIRLDVRYATTNNFMSSVFYDEPRVFLQRPAAEAVVRIHRGLASRGYGLLLFDGYRPWYVTKMFWDATPESQKIFVADPASGSRHNRGSAIDLTLYDLATGQPVEMVGGYDEFSPRSFPDYPGGTSRQRWLREILRRAMEAEGFAVYEAEWWHFDHEDWREYAIRNATFGELAGGREREQAGAR